jgi:hypothetical protein
MTTRTVLLLAMHCSAWAVLGQQQSGRSERSTLHQS